LEENIDGFIKNIVVGLLFLKIDYLDKRKTGSLKRGKY